MTRIGAFALFAAMFGVSGFSHHSLPVALTGIQAAASASEGGGDISPKVASLQHLIEDGHRIYERRCGACHSLDRNRVGPRHRNVYGSRAGSVKGFRYSKALQELNITWDDESLDAWLENPTAFAPGTAMGFRLDDEDERKAVIAYLKSVSPTNQ